MSALAQGQWKTLAEVFEQAALLNSRQLAEVKKDAGARVQARGPKEGSKEAVSRKEAVSVLDGEGTPQEGLQRKVEPLFKKLNKDLDQKNDSIDTANNYKREQARCSSW